MKHAKACILIFPLLFLPACEAITPENKESSLEKADIFQRQIDQKQAELEVLRQEAIDAGADTAVVQSQLDRLERVELELSTHRAAIANAKTDTDLMRHGGAVLGGLPLPYAGLIGLAVTTIAGVIDSMRQRKKSSVASADAKASWHAANENGNALHNIARTIAAVAEAGNGIIDTNSDNVKKALRTMGPKATGALRAAKDGVI